MQFPLNGTLREEKDHRAREKGGPGKTDRLQRRGNFPSAHTSCRPGARVGVGRRLGPPSPTPEPLLRGAPCGAPCSSPRGSRRDPNASLRFPGVPSSAASPPSEATAAPRPEAAWLRRRCSPTPRPVKSAGDEQAAASRQGPTPPVTLTTARPPAEARLPAPARRGPHPDLAADLGADLHGSGAGGGLSTARGSAHWEPESSSQPAASTPPPPPLPAARSA